MKKTFGIIAASAFAIAAISAPVAAGAGDAPAYGKNIKACFGGTYGQVKNEAWAIGHATPPAAGAKLTFEVHKGLC